MTCTLPNIGYYLFTSPPRNSPKLYISKLQIYGTNKVLLSCCIINVKSADCQLLVAIFYADQYLPISIFASTYTDNDTR